MGRNGLEYEDNSVCKCEGVQGMIQAETEL